MSVVENGETSRLKKVNIRRAHRSSTTRYINQIRGAVDADDKNRLRQLTLHLSDKRALLVKLDEEILDLTGEEGLEAEILTADEVRERIDIAILTLEDAISSTSRRRSRSTSSSSAPSIAGEEEQQPPSSGLSSGQPITTPVVPVTTLSVSIATPVATTTWTPSSAPDPSLTGPFRDLTISSTSAVTTPTWAPLSSMGTFSPLVSPLIPPLIPAGPVGVPTTSIAPWSSPPLPSVWPVGVPSGIDHGVPTYSAASTPTTHVVPSASQVRLPKLSLRKFNGDLTKWTSFWDSFSSAVHLNPSLSPIDKFNYLVSLLESTAAEAIGGLAITSANYEEAVLILRRRFGNQQLIINKHMEALLGVSAVPSHLEVKSLRRLIDTTETHIRGLRALGVQIESYGGILTPVLIDKLPPEIRLIVSREMTEEGWPLDSVMKILEREVGARERAMTATASPRPRKSGPRVATGAALLAGGSSPSDKEPVCVYCSRHHLSASCTIVTDVAERKDVLRKSGRCYVCLRKNHLSRKCRSHSSCRVCHGRHHSSICPNQGLRQTDTFTASPGRNSTDVTTTSASTNTMYAGDRMPVLLQTARVQVFERSSPETQCTARAILDCGSQRTYVSEHLRDELRLPKKGTETLRIKTFGTSETRDSCCDVVRLDVRVENGEVLTLHALVVPLICDPLASQPIDAVGESYDHLAGLQLADSAQASDLLRVDILIGSDSYWAFVTGRIVRGDRGPTAVHTRVGWVLSGPSGRVGVVVNLAVSSLAVGVNSSLEHCLKRFWDLESLGVASEESSVYDTFVQKITFDGHRYEVRLPWKEWHPPLPDHRELCKKRLLNLLKKLRQTPNLLQEYNAIICEQLSKGIIEPVSQSHDVSERTHYLPHHGVTRRDKSTSKLRIVYDASARTVGPSLNDCLYTGPKFCQLIFDIILRFRLHQIVVTGDVEKAFLMLSIHPSDRDSLRFLWVDDPNADTPSITAYRFTRAVFGVSSSPFLLNATINHHIGTYQELDPDFVHQFLSSIYVDDLVSGADDIDSAFEFYQKCRVRLAAAGFNLRKFASNSAELLRRIHENESAMTEDHLKGPRWEEDQSYAKSSLGGLNDPGSSNRLQKVLGVGWDTVSDMIQIDLREVATTMEGLQPTKRNVVSVASKFFDPIGIVAPVTVLFKILAQQLCEEKVGWDETLVDDHLRQWNGLLLDLKASSVIELPRCVHTGALQSASLIGFCDASLKAYAAVVYLRIGDSLRFMAAKTRVAPLKRTTIPRMELLSALLLSRLIMSISEALEHEIVLTEMMCYTDSRVVLYWIRGSQHEWKQFVQNRVNSIRSLVAPGSWHHCPGLKNPADIPSRGCSPHCLMTNPIWLNGPDLAYLDDSATDADSVEPKEYSDEMKACASHSLAAAEGIGLGKIIDIERFSTAYHLFKVTAMALRFTDRLRGVRQGDHSHQSEFERARILWIKDSQTSLLGTSQRKLALGELGLYLDEFGVWRCGGRMSKSCLSLAAQNPVLLMRDHQLTRLLVMDAHRRVHHNGVRETLVELRSQYWVIRGRQLVRKLVRGCTVCRRLEGRACRGNPPPPLPEFRVQRSRPFQFTGVDFAGPLFIRTSKLAENNKIWLCLYTCCTTRAVHLDLVPNMTVATFLMSFRRFTARRGVPSKVISDNAQTFKSASKLITHLVNSPEAGMVFKKLNVEWRFNLERAPWWGGIFERMIGSTKRCLKKSIGRNCLTYDELITLVTEVEGVLNSRPLTYVSSEDLEEPLTPSHLLLGYRVLSLPDASVVDSTDPDYATTGDIPNRMTHLSKVLGHFWKRWQREYLSGLREFHRSRRDNGSEYLVKEGDIVIVFDENHPRSFWKLGRVQEMISGLDGVVRGVCVKVASGSGRPKVLRRPLQRIYPLELRTCSPHDPGGEVHSDRNVPVSCPDPLLPVSSRSARRAATEARYRIKRLAEDQSIC